MEKSEPGTPNKAVFQILRYFPDPIRDEFVNIGIVLYEIEGESPMAELRVTRDWGRVLCLDPEADIDYLQGLEGQFARKDDSGGAAITPEYMERQFSTSLRVTQSVDATTAKGIQSGDGFAGDMERLMRMFVEPRSAARERKTRKHRQRRS